jgi:hypothetical protein
VLGQAGNPPPLHPSETRSDIRQDRKRDAGVPFEETQELSPWQLQHVELVGRDDRGRSWLPVEQRHLAQPSPPKQTPPGNKLLVVAVLATHAWIPNVHIPIDQSNPHLQRGQTPPPRTSKRNPAR